MRVNALLIRWADGYRRRTDSAAISANTRIEALHSIEHVTHAEEADRQADKELDRFATGQKQITVEIDPTGSGDVPFTDWFLGDKLTIDGATRRVVSLAFGRDKDRPGRVEYEVGFGDRIETPEKRMHRQLKKMSNGAGGGSFRTASPPQPKDKGRASIADQYPDRPIIIDSQSTGAITAESDPVPIHGSTSLVGVKIRAVSSAADTDVTITVNGTLQETHTLPSGDTTYSAPMATPLAIDPDDHEVIVGVDGDAVGLVAQLIFNDGAGGAAPA